MRPRESWSKDHYGAKLLLGIAQGGSFSLALMFIVFRSRVASQLSGMVQGVG